MAAVITSRSNARVRELRLALAARKPADVVALEGPNLVAEAARSATAGSLEIAAVFVREDRTHLVPPLLKKVETVVLSAEAFASAAATEHSQGIAALIRRPAFVYNPSENDLLLIAAGIQDPGNLGTLVRSAEAFGAAAVLCTEGTVDAWNGKALRASAGSILRMPVASASHELLAAVKRASIQLLAAMPGGAGAIAAQDVDWHGGCAVMVGNEGSGIAADLLAMADRSVTIAMAGEMESLNAAVAGSVLLYEAFRQRRQ